MSDDKIIGYKVMKGRTLERAELDSTWPDKKRANNRRDTLKKSLRKTRYTAGPKLDVWVVPMVEGDPHHYRKPKRGPWEGYNRSGPEKIKE